MILEFHTTLSIQKRGAHGLEDFWVQAILEWHPDDPSPSIIEFTCDDSDFLHFWDTSRGAEQLEAAIINDVMRLKAATYPDVEEAKRRGAH